MLTADNSELTDLYLKILHAQCYYKCMALPAASY